MYIMQYTPIIQVMISSLGLLAIYFSYKAFRTSVRALYANRAWVLFSDFEWVPYVENHNNVNRTVGIRIKIWYKNSGRSPAINALGSSMVRRSDKSDYFPTYKFRPKKDSLSVIGMDKSISLTCIIKGDDYQNLLARSGRVFIGSEIIYNDIYEPKISRISQYSVEVKYLGDMQEIGKPNQIDLSFIATGAQNKIS